MKPIIFSVHARDQAALRGVTTDEIIEAIRTARWSPAKQGRLECRKDFPHVLTWRGKTYTTKQVRPVFVDEHDAIIVVTVYTYFY